MHLHLPKPLHGWREFAGEVGIIVIGVLIALGAEQAVESLHDRSVAQQTRLEVTNELNGDLMSLALRDRAEPCIQRRLNELRAILAQWEATGSFQPPKWVAQTPVIEVESSRFEGALAGSRMGMLSGEEQYRMGAVASRIRAFDQDQVDERVLWGRLRALQAGPRALSVADRAAIRTALQDASTQDYEVRVSTRQVLPMARRYGFRPDGRAFREMAGEVWKGGKYAPSICTPINTPPEIANKTQVTPLPL
jgi:hypothetical protein